MPRLRRVNRAAPFSRASPLPGAMIVPSFRRDYTTAVNDAIRRTETKMAPGVCFGTLSPSAV